MPKLPIMTVKSNASSIAAMSDHGFHNKSLWWERSVIKRSALAIDEIVEGMVDESRFLQQAEEVQHLQQYQQQQPGQQPTVALLNRSNVQIGRLLGKGSFSVVYEVISLVDEDRDGCDFDDDYHDHDDDNNDVNPASSSSSSSSTGLSSSLTNMAKQGRLAIKHLRPDLLHKKDQAYFQGAAADLIQEAKFLAALNHPNILKVHAVARGDAFAYHTSGGLYDGFFLVTDRLQGTLKDKIMEWQCLQQDESLLECFRLGVGGDNNNTNNTVNKQLPKAQEEVKEGDLSGGVGQLQYTTQGDSNYRAPSSMDLKLLREKLDIARQLGSAIQYLHERRLIWRDCKPPNVGILDNTVQLFDLGFCRELPSTSSSYPLSPSYSSDLTDHQASGGDNDENTLFYMSGKGSLMYLAPEVLQNGRYNQKADVYSYSMVLYELLSLNKPFHSVPNQDVFRELICHHKARPPLEYSNIPVPLQDLLRHAWDDNVYNRWTMHQVCDRLEEIYSDFEKNEWGGSSQQGLVVAASPLQQVAAAAVESHKNSTANDEAAEQLKSTSDGAFCGGGLVMDLLVGWASVVRRGQRILPQNGNDKFKLTIAHQEPQPGKPMLPALPTKGLVHFKSSPMHYGDSKYLDSSLVELSGAATAETEDCSITTEYDDSSSSLVCKPAMANEDPLEVTLEQTLSMGTSLSLLDEYDDDDDDDIDDDYRVDDTGDDRNEAYGHHDGHHNRQEDDRMDNTNDPFLSMDAAEMEMRCPPSPLARTFSAPTMPQQTKDNNTANVNLSPSVTPRRQSYGGKEINFPESHWLPAPTAQLQA